MKKELLTQLETLSYSIDYNDYCSFIDGASIKSFELMHDDFNYWLNGYLDIENKSNFYSYCIEKVTISIGKKHNIPEKVLYDLVDPKRKNSEHQKAKLSGYALKTDSIHLLIKAVSEMYKALNISYFYKLKVKFISLLISPAIFSDIFGKFGGMENYLMMLSDFNMWYRALDKKDENKLSAYYNIVLK